MRERRCPKPARSPEVTSSSRTRPGDPDFRQRRPASAPRAVATVLRLAEAPDARTTCDRFGPEVSARSAFAAGMLTQTVRLWAIRPHFRVPWLSGWGSGLV